MKTVQSTYSGLKMIETRIFSHKFQIIVRKEYGRQILCTHLTFLCSPNVRHDRYLYLCES